MDILGILGHYLENGKNMVHIYNRFVLESMHVRNSAYQSLFDLRNKFDTMNCFDEIIDSETIRIRDFINCNINNTTGVFDLKELGDLQEEVFKYSGNVIKEEEIINVDSFIK